MPVARTAVLLVALLAGCSRTGGGPEVLPTLPPAPTTTASTTTSIGSTPATADTTSPATTVVGDVPTGFGSTTAVVTKPDGTTCELCLWLADTAPQRRRGLMSVDSLGGPVGMAFRYEAPRTGTFWMENVRFPLSIAFYGDDGAYLDAFDMETCTTGSCPNYATPADFLVAVEVPEGEVDQHGLTPGSSLELLDVPCA